LIPLEIEAYLTYRYNDWKTPVHRTEYSCYSSDNCIITNPETILELIGKYDIAITFGAFEKFHYGHRNLIINAKKKCKNLIVCVSDDDYIRTHKNHEPVTTIGERIEKIKECPEVDIVDIQSNINNKKCLVEKYNPDIIIVGDDWTPQTFSGANLDVPVIYLPRTENISSSLLRKTDETTKIDYSSDLTVFVITSGTAPNLSTVLEALKNQSCNFKLDIIENYSPMSAAFQQMLDRCTTNYRWPKEKDTIQFLAERCPSVISILLNWAAIPGVQILLNPSYRVKFRIKWKIRWFSPLRWDRECRILPP
jgi:glycerol-3-phosphate cytidylyltransferase